MRPVRQQAVHSLWSRLFCGPLKMRRVPEEAVFGTEYLFRTVEACFCAPNASEDAPRTGGGLFEHGTHIRYRRGPFPVPSAVEGAGEGSAAAEPGALRQVAAVAERAAMSQAR